MGELCEGDRTFDAVTNTAASSVSINLMQDQLKDMTGPLSMAVLRLGIGGAGVAGAASWIPATSLWDCAGGTFVEFPIPVRTGQEITGVNLLLMWTGAKSAGGEAAIVSRSNTHVVGARAAESVEVVLDADPWNYSATGVYYNDASTATGLTVTVAADTDYFVRIEGIAAAANGFVAGVDVLAQFGN